MPMPVHCSASGKLLLAFGPPVVAAGGHLPICPVHAYTKNTITSARGPGTGAGHDPPARLFDRRSGVAVWRELSRCSGAQSQPDRWWPGLAVMAPVASHPLENLGDMCRICKDLRGAYFGGARLETAALPARTASRAPSRSRQRYPPRHAQAQATSKSQANAPTSQANMDLTHNDVQSILKIIDAAEHLDEIEIVHRRTFGCTSCATETARRRARVAARTAAVSAPQAIQTATPLASIDAETRRRHAVPDGVSLFARRCSASSIEPGPRARSRSWRSARRVRADDTVCSHRGDEAVQLHPGRRRRRGGQDSRRQRRPGGVRSAASSS